ncbi:MAG TPA: hypothetical protein ENL10_01560 [Candidatus Cloacimonetes bacterium]|nr:hypothetical protein [Candidatus Cloacimonadota bacterium]
MNNESNKNLRWRDYFLRQGTDFFEFWKRYLNSKEHDVLFVVGLGFDPRTCTAVENILNAGGNGKRDCFLLEFDEGEGSPSKRYEHHTSSNRSKLEKMFNERGEIIRKDIKILSKDGRRIGSRSAANVFSSINDLTNYTDIIVDISATPRALYFPIIGKLLYLYDSNSTDNGKSKNLNIHVVVVENPTLDYRIRAEGIDDKANYVHGFGGDVELESTANIPRVWIPIIGEKRDAHMTRIHTLVNNPKEICPVLPFPATNPRRGDDLILEYRELLFDQLRVEPTNIVYAAEQNPFEVYRKIARTVIQYNKALSPLGGCKVIVSSLSSKLLSIGALLAAYDLKRKGFAIGIAHVGAQGYTMPEGDQITESKCQEELCSLWLAGECYDA